MRTLAVSLVSLYATAARVRGSPMPGFNGTTSGPRASSGCGTTPPAAGNHVVTVQDPLGGSIQRRFRIYYPSSYDQFAATPVVIDYHGYGNSGNNQESSSGIRAGADTFGYIAVFPTGFDDVESQQMSGSTSWNGVGTVASPGPLGQTCQWASSSAEYSCMTSCRPSRGCQSNRYAAGCDCSSCVDDVLFAELMMNYLQDEFCVDPNRIHVTGFSNGGMMAFELAQSRLAPRIASIAPVCSSPLMGFNDGPARPMAIMELHGNNDRIIPANCSQQGVQCGPNDSPISSDGYYYEPLTRVMSTWGQTNGCQGASRHYPTRFDGNGGMSCIEQEGNCPTGTTVVRCAYNAGHTYPFGSGNAARLNYATMIWEFFTLNPLSSN